MQRTYRLPMKFFRRFITKDVVAILTALAFGFVLFVGIWFIMALNQLILWVDKWMFGV